MIFTQGDWFKLATLFDTGRGLEGGAPYAGYRPEMREVPNGDTKPCEACANGRPRKGPGGAVAGSACPVCDGTGRVPNVDTGKRFLHVNLKYDPPDWAVAYLARAHWEACRVAEALGVPDAYYPRAENGTLRVLEYPAGAGSVQHTDFDLFTILCWRSHPADLIRDDNTPAAHEANAYNDRLDSVSPGLHIGEIGELADLGPAAPHYVPARPYVQRSIIYFAMPANAARLPGPGAYGDCAACGANVTPHGPTVAEWLAERVARSRVYT